ncbi:MAG: methylamine utilization protein [Cellvibrionaceae bacterium]
MKLPLILLSLLLSLAANSQPLSVLVLDSQGEPFEGAVVELQHPDAKQSNELPQAAMDQINKQFAPYLLVVEQDTPVVFPNSDSIKHHVFSFSAAKRFQLKLYKDRQPEPLIFDNPGVVALGCNIHDWMVGYIYVAQSSLYLESDKAGLTHFDVTPRQYQLRVWHPRFNRVDAERRLTLTTNTNQVTFTLTEPLHPMLDDQADEFESY